MTFTMRGLAVAAVMHIVRGQNEPVPEPEPGMLTVQVVGVVNATPISCPVPACTGQTVSEIPGTSASDGWAIGDIVNICKNDMSYCDTNRKIVGFNSILVTPPVTTTFTNPIITLVTPASMSAGNDPIAWFGKDSKEFWLPVGKLTPILHTRHLSMLASSFVGSPQEQWMDRIVVTNSDGFRLADIRIKKNIAEFNRSRSSGTAFETIDLTLGMSSAPLTEMPKDLEGGRKKYYSRMEVSVVTERLNKVFNWLPFHIDQAYIGKARREAVIITSPDARFIIISSPATEYYGAVSYLSVDYAHLDIHILDMKNRASIRGLLPELWGLKKMSNRTRAMCTPPWSKEGQELKADLPVDVDVDAEWNKRFFAV